MKMLFANICTTVKTVFQQNAKIRRDICFTIFPNNAARTTARCKTTITPRRAILYVPGNDLRKIQKISAIDVDCVVLDLEDGVASNKKSEARKLISEISYDFNFGRSEFAVRINSVDSGLWETDLTTLFSGSRIASTIMIPKVDSVKHVQQVIDCIYNLAQKRQLKENLQLVLFVESARSLLDLGDICREAKRLCENKLLSLEGLVFGSDDFCADIGATRTSEGTELLTARQMIVMIGKSFGLQVIDMVHIDYKDLDGLELYSKQGAGMGFTGKQVIHPTQVPIVQKAFFPSKEKIAWAAELIKLFEEHQKHGRGAFTFRGAMIDKPLLLQAEYVLKVGNTLNQTNA